MKRSLNKSHQMIAFNFSFLFSKCQVSIANTLVQISVTNNSQNITRENSEHWQWFDFFEKNITSSSAQHFQISAVNMRQYHKLNKEVRRNKKRYINLKKTRIKNYAQQGQRLRSLAPDVNQIEVNYSRALKSVTHFMCQICYNRNKFGIGFSGIICARSYYLFDGLFYWRLSFHCSERHCASFKFFSFYSLNRIVYGCFFPLCPHQMCSFFFIDHIYKFSIVSTVGLQKNGLV